MSVPDRVATYYFNSQIVPDGQGLTTVAISIGHCSSVSQFDSLVSKEIAVVVVIVF